MPIERESAVAGAEPAEGAFDIVALWNLLWRNRLLIGAFGLVGAAIAAALALPATPMSRAEVHHRRARSGPGFGQQHYAAIRRARGARRHQSLRRGFRGSRLTRRPEFAPAGRTIRGATVGTERAEPRRAARAVTVVHGEALPRKFPVDQRGPAQGNDHRG